MPRKASLQGSSTISSFLVRMSPSVIIGPRPLFTQFMMIVALSILLIGFLPHVSCTPTRLSDPIENTNNNNKMNYDSNAFMFGQNDYRHGSQQDQSLIPSSVQGQPPSESSTVWYGQPRAHANQFLMSHVNLNDMVLPKWFTQLNYDDDVEDDTASGISVNKRSPYYSTGGYSMLNKRKQVTKPPMEVMNEIVNSIYLKR